MLTMFLPYNSLNGPSIQSLLIQPQRSRFCNTYREKFNEQCSGDGNSAICEEIRQDISDCLSTVKSAYDEINYVCLERNAMYQTCTMTCEGGGRGDAEDTSRSQDTAKENSNSKDDNNSACHNKCADKKNALLVCEERVVQKWLKKEGFDDWHAQRHLVDTNNLEWGIYAADYEQEDDSNADHTNADAVDPVSSVKLAAKSLFAKPKSFLSSKFKLTDAAGLAGTAASSCCCC